MRWSTKLIIAGLAICLIGVVPPYVSGLTITALENAASFIAVGLLFLLVGVMLRKLQRTFN